MSIFIRNIVSYNVVRDSRHTNIVYSTTTTKQKNVCLEALNLKKKYLRCLAYSLGYLICFPWE